MEIDKENKDWSRFELEAAVDSYLKMLEWEGNGQKVNTTYENRLLREGALTGRSEGSVEFRMLNISTVLDRMGRKRVNGYKSLPHIDSRIESSIRDALANRGVFSEDKYSPTADDVLLERRAVALQKQKLKNVPKGILTPERAPGANTSYVRDPWVRAWVRQEADGHCEGCGKPAPFLKLDLPFLEVHHVKPLAEKGSDRTSNAVALCPNCHRRCDHSDDSKEFTEALYQTVKRLKRE